MKILFNLHQGNMSKSQTEIPEPCEGIKKSQTEIPEPYEGITGRA